MRSCRVSVLDLIVFNTMGKEIFMEVSTIVGGYDTGGTALTMAGLPVNVITVGNGASCILQISHSKNIITLNGKTPLEIAEPIKGPVAHN